MLRIGNDSGQLVAMVEVMHAVKPQFTSNLLISVLPRDDCDPVSAPNTTLRRSLCDLVAQLSFYYILLTAHPPPLDEHFCAYNRNIIFSPARFSGCVFVHPGT